MSSNFLSRRRSLKLIFGGFTSLFFAPVLAKMQPAPTPSQGGVTGSSLGAVTNTGPGLVTGSAGLTGGSAAFQGGATRLPSLQTPGGLPSTQPSGTPSQ